MFDRNTYFDAVRDTMFSGAMSQEQVDGQNAIPTSMIRAGVIDSNVTAPSRNRSSRR